MGRTTTMENIITLTSLAFLESVTTAKDVAKYLGITTRQARTILSTMVQMGYAKKVGHGKYYVHDAPRKAIKVVKSVLYMLYKMIEAKEAKG